MASTTVLLIILLILLVILTIGLIYTIYKNKSKKVKPEEILKNKAETRINKEEQHLKVQLNQLKQVEMSTPEIAKHIEEKIEVYENKLSELPKKIETYKIETNKSGYIYILTNYKTYNRLDLYKIGMTRRNDAEKRIKELCNAAICAPFHIVCIIFSENAPELESKLHKELEKYRYVKENKRKEFFKLDKEILTTVVKKYDILADLKFEEVD